MATEWKKVRLGETFTVKKGQAITKRESKEGPYPVILGGREPAYFIDRFNHEGKAIVVSRSGASAGYVSFWNEPIFITDGFLIEPNNDVCYEYIYYLMKNNQSRFIGSQKGAAIPHVTPALLSDIDILLPPLETQQKIAGILSAYDDLIENNLKQIKLLEEAAQKLYKEWFVKLNFPGHENVKIVDGVPEGWIETDIKSICTKINAGGTPNRKKTEYWNNKDVKWFKTKELQDCWLYDSEEYISQKGLENSSAKIFPENTILMAIYASPTLGRLGILTNAACCNQAALCMIANEEIISYQWLYLKLMELREYFNSVARGAGQQNISADVVKNKTFLLPSKSLLDIFTKIIKPYFDKIRYLQNQIQLLQSARDKLLPKLMNGEYV